MRPIKVSRRALLRNSSYKDISNTLAEVTVVVSTGAYVYREEQGPNGDVYPFERGLEISESAIRMERLLGGAPVLDNHKDNESVKRQIGKVVDAWIEEKDGIPLLCARLQISKVTKEQKQIAQMIKDETIGHVSVGAEIHNQKDVTTDHDEFARILANDWEPYEVSIVSVPADAGAIIRNKGESMGKYLRKRKERREGAAEEIAEEVVEEITDETFMKEAKRQMPDETAEEILEEVVELAKRNAPDAAAVEEVAEAVEEAVEEVASDALTRTKETRQEGDVEEVVEEVLEEAVEEASRALPEDATPAEVAEAVEEVVEEVVDEASRNLPEDVVEEVVEEVEDELKRKAKRMLMKKLRAKRKSAKRSYKRGLNKMRIHSRRARVAHDRRTDDLKHKELRAHAAQAVAAKIAPTMFQESDKSPFQGLSMVETCKEMLYRNGFTETRNWKSYEVYDFMRSNRERRSLGPFGTSSDFEDLFTDSVNKAVLQSYEMERGEQTFTPFVKKRTAKDFKKLYTVQAGESGKLVKTEPGADAQIVTIDDRKEEYQLASYEKIFQLTRQAFINDDTGQLQTILLSGGAAADLESDLVYEQLQTGMVGGAALYSTARKNLTASAALDSNSDPYKGLEGMHTGFGTQVGLDGETKLNFKLGYLVVPVALDIAAHQAFEVNYASQPRYQNPLMGRGIEIVAEPRLDDTSATSYYGVAKQAAGVRTFIELAYLGGKKAPITKFEEKSGNSVMAWHMIHDVAAKVVDYRLAHKCTA